MPISSTSTELYSTLMAAYTPTLSPAAWRRHGTSALDGRRRRCTAAPIPQFCAMLFASRRSTTRYGSRVWKKSWSACGRPCMEARQHMSVTVMPGVLSMLAYLKSRGKVLGVATGNLEQIGWLKIEIAGLRDWFSFGGFSDRHAVRSDMIANARWTETCRRPTSKCVWSVTRHRISPQPEPTGCPPLPWLPESFPIRPYFSTIPRSAPRHSMPCCWSRNRTPKTPIPSGSRRSVRNGEPVDPIFVCFPVQVIFRCTSGSLVTCP